MPLVELLASSGIIPGIKVDAGAQAAGGRAGRARHRGPRRAARAARGVPARWARASPSGARCSSSATGCPPRAACTRTRTRSRATPRSARSRGWCPIVEPEVLMDGAHTLERCEEVTEQRAAGGVRRSSSSSRWRWKGCCSSRTWSSRARTARGRPRCRRSRRRRCARLRGTCRRRCPAIVFLSGGQDHLLATEHLNAINQLAAPQAVDAELLVRPRAAGRSAGGLARAQRERLRRASSAFYHRAACDSAAVAGLYSSAMESEPAPI